MVSRHFGHLGRKFGGSSIKSSRKSVRTTVSGDATCSETHTAWVHEQGSFRVACVEKAIRQIPGPGRVGTMIRPDTKNFAIYKLEAGSPTALTIEAAGLDAATTNEVAFVRGVKNQMRVALAEACALTGTLLPRSACSPSELGAREPYRALPAAHSRPPVR